jgi:ADP-ribosyl-[dinitrogen reductase] hydrolase
MLIEIAIADAYGAGFEFLPEDPARPNDASAYYAHLKRGTEPGQYTDDTQCSLAIAECLLAGTTAPRDIAAAILEAYRRDRRRGYMPGFRKVLDRVGDADELLATLRPNSVRSGAAMRAGPIGLLTETAAVHALATTQARITHDSPGGTGAAQGAALMVHYLLRGLGPLAGLPGFLAAQAPDVDWHRPMLGPTDTTGEQIARAALGVVLRARSLTEALLLSVAQRGDTDTVGAIAMAALSVAPGIARDLPEGLIAGLERGPYGADYLMALDQRLAGRFAAPIVSAGPRG